MAQGQLGKWEYEAEELVQQFTGATKRGREAGQREPQARSVQYDQQANRLLIELKNGAVLLLPCHLLQGLAGAAPEDMAQVALGPRGAALHWEKLEVDFSVAGLLAGDFGNAADCVASEKAAAPSS